MEPVNEINIPKIEERPPRGNKKAVVIVCCCLAVFAAFIMAGIFIIRAYNSDERKLIKGIRKLAVEMAERQQLWKEASGDTPADGSGSVKMETCLNLSGDGLPITIGMDTAMLRDGGAHRVRSSAALSVMNNELLEMVLYGDDEKLMLSVPDLWRQNLEFAPENIDIQYNSSLLAEKFGQIESSGISIELFPEKDSISRSENVKFLLEKIIDILKDKKKGAGDPDAKISVEKLEGTIMIAGYDKGGKLSEDDKQYECSVYRMIIPKEWLEGMQPDNGENAGMQAADTAVDIMQDAVLLVYMEKDGGIIRISPEEPLQFRMKYGEYVETAELEGDVYFLGEKRSIDAIAVNLEAEITTGSLNPKEGGLFGVSTGFHGEEKQRLCLEAEIKYDKADARTTMDIDKLTISVDDDSAIRVTGEISIEPLKEEVLPLDGETIRLFEITEDEYEDLRSQLQKKLLKWLAMLSFME